MAADAYKEGYMAFEEGRSILENPYEYNDELFDDWEYGYKTARRVEEEWDI